MMMLSVQAESWLKPKDYWLVYHPEQLQKRLQSWQKEKNLRIKI
jgi:hypothetical protein